MNANDMDPENGRYTFDDYLRDHLTDEGRRIEWGGEEALARVAVSLYRARDQRGLSQTKLADRAGTKQPNISAIENGEGNPTVRTLGRLAAALRVDVAELLSGYDRYGVYRQTGFNLRGRISLTGTTPRPETSADRLSDVFYSPEMQKGPDSERGSARPRSSGKLVA